MSLIYYHITQKVNGMTVGFKKMIFVGAALFIVIAALYVSVSAAKTLDELSNNTNVKSVSQETLLQWLSEPDFSEKYVLIDVRTPIEYRIGKITTAINIPHYDILNDVSLLDPYKDKEMILYCRSGVRVGKVTRLLSSLHYTNLSHLNGDMGAWKKNKRPME